MGDEKIMSYRKTVHSGASIDANDPSDDSFQGVSSEDSNKLTYDVEAHKKLTKSILCGIVDGTLTGAFRYVQFTWTKPQAPEFTTIVDPTYVQKQ